jgi:hypothetical protein
MTSGGFAAQVQEPGLPWRHFLVAKSHFFHFVGSSYGLASQSSAFQGTVSALSDEPSKVESGFQEKELATPREM